MVIREAITADLPAIAKLWNHYILNSTYNYDYEPKKADFFEKWLKDRQDLNLPVFVVEVEGELAGYGYYGQFRGRDGYLHSAEHGLYFDEKFQGNGFGRLLLEHLMKDAKERGFHTMVAGIDSSNPGSIIFHKRMGFEMVGTFREIGYKNGKWLDCVFLQKFL
ncbi:GNAT family N-acetyltransferase [Jiulongibacter sediminis]|uniref:GNAT family N-acetyltransferase n=1 Tax=Jiulongibacter sediminis TaxID=1605367 RepID=UPI0026F07EC8|nr:GNAT family N-acetyltransferase [Jiulongibacter sediminis]